MNIATRLAEDIMLTKLPFTRYRMMNQSRTDWIFNIMHFAYVLMGR